MGPNRPTGSWRPPSRRDDLQDAFESTALTGGTKTNRCFLPFGRRTIALDRPQVLPRTALRLGAIPWLRFVLRIEETRAFHYKPAAWAAGSAKAPAPDPDFIKQFCIPAFKTDTTFRATTLPHAGLWTPTGSKPFVFPLESEYLPLIPKNP
jgi:hypothetical protein